MIKPGQIKAIEGLGDQYDAVKNGFNRLRVIYVRDAELRALKESEQAKLELGLRIKRLNEEEGVTVSDICRVLGTSSRKTVYELIKFAEDNA